MKIALGIEYNGKQYCGWQRQEKVRGSVQEELEKALSLWQMKKLKCFVGRTDSGVHGTGQVVHLKLQQFAPKKHGHLVRMRKTTGRDYKRN